MCPDLLIDQSEFGIGRTMPRVGLQPCREAAPVHGIIFLANQPGSGLFVDLVDIHVFEPVPVTDEPPSLSDRRRGAPTASAASVRRR